MRVVITTAGSRGDVAPYTGLARRLNDDGLKAVIATHEPFRAFVESHGIDFAGLPADPRQLLATEQGRRWQRSTSGSVGAVRMVQLMRPYAREMVRQALSVPSYRARAEALAGRLAEEDGAGAVVDAVARLAEKP